MEFKIKDKITVAERIIGLYAVVLKTKEDTSDFYQWYQNKGIEQYLSVEEKEFMTTDKPNECDIIEFSWRQEALVSLLWATKLIDYMPALNQTFDIFSIKELPQILHNFEDFKSSIQLRSKDELDEMENELYNEHWRVRDAQLFGKEMPEDLDPDVVYERRYALSWLVGWADDWDNVPTDT